MSALGKKLLLGAGCHAAVVTKTILALRDKENNTFYDCIDYLDDNSEEAIGKIEELEDIGKNYAEVFCCMGNITVQNPLVEDNIRVTK